MRLSALLIYPVKSLRGCSVSFSEVDSLGLVGDRRFMVVDESGRFVTQRTLPKMALIDTALSTSELTLSHAEYGQVSVSTGRNAAAAARSVSVWGSTELSAEDCGEEAADWLGEVLSFRCRLVRIGERFRRPVIRGGGGRDDLVSFADAFPVLILGESSLAELNDRLISAGNDAMTLERFRPNLVFSGGEPFDEDHWHRFRIGPMTFRASGPCARCTITTINPDTGERDFEPLRTLATYRRDPTNTSEINFGQNLVHETKSGTLRLGDPIEILG